MPKTRTFSKFQVSGFIPQPFKHRFIKLPVMTDPFPPVDRVPGKFLRCANASPLTVGNTDRPGIKPLIMAISPVAHLGDRVSRGVERLEVDSDESRNRRGIVRVSGRSRATSLPLFRRNPSRSLRPSVQLLFRLQVSGLQSQVCFLGSYPLMYRQISASLLNASQSFSGCACFTTSIRPGSVELMNTFAANTRPIFSSPQ